MPDAWWRLIASGLIGAGLSACEPETGEPNHPNLGGAQIVPVGVVDASSGFEELLAQPSHLPCDIDALVKQRCRGCHSPSTQPHRPVSLLSYADFTQPSKSIPGQTYAQQAEGLVRTGMMPPTAALSADDIERFSSWVRSGAPSAECGAAPVLDAGHITQDAAPVVPLDAAVSDVADAGALVSDAPADAGVDAFAAPPACSSGQHWTAGDMRSPLMHPGRACIACHTNGTGLFNLLHGPSFGVAGTLFATAHEPDDCDGFSQAGARVMIKDASGRSTTLIPNRAGNFYSTARVTPPYAVEIQYQGRVRMTLAPHRDGDCNSCHTQGGTGGAPGRIVLP